MKVRKVGTQRTAVERRDKPRTRLGPGGPVMQRPFDHGNELAHGLGVVSTGAARREEQRGYLLPHFVHLGVRVEVGVGV